MFGSLPVHVGSKQVHFVHCPPYLSCVECFPSSVPCRCFHSHSAVLVASWLLVVTCLQCPPAAVMAAGRLLRSFFTPFATTAARWSIDWSTPFPPLLPVRHRRPLSSRCCRQYSRFALFLLLAVSLIAATLLLNRLPAPTPSTSSRHSTLMEQPSLAQLTAAAVSTSQPYCLSCGTTVVHCRSVQCLRGARSSLVPLPVVV